MNVSEDFCDEVYNQILIAIQELRIASSDQNEKAAVATIRKRVIDAVMDDAKDFFNN